MNNVVNSKEGPKKDWNHLVHTIRWLSFGININEFIEFLDCSISNDLEVIRNSTLRESIVSSIACPCEKTPGAIIINGQMALRTLQAIYALTGDDVFQIEAQSIPAICAEIGEDFEILHSEQIVCLSGLLLEYAGFVSPKNVVLPDGSNGKGFALQQKGRDAVFVLGILAENEPDEYGKYVRSSLSPNVIKDDNSEAQHTS